MIRTHIVRRALLLFFGLVYGYINLSLNSVVLTLNNPDEQQAPASNTSTLINPDEQQAPAFNASSFHVIPHADIPRTHLQKHELPLVNLTSRRCGAFKCFVASEKNPSQVGYLVTIDRRGLYRFNSEPYFISQAMWQSFQMAQALQREYGIRHFYLEPPRLLSNVSQTDAKRLGKLGLFRTGSELVLQKVRPISEPMLELSCGGDRIQKRKKSWDELQSWIEQGFVSDTAKFFQTLQRELDVVNVILLRYPILQDDFQILFNNRGEIFQIDLDRAFANPGMSEPKWDSHFRTAWRQCQGNIQRWVDASKRAVKRARVAERAAKKAKREANIPRNVIQ